MTQTHSTANDNFPAHRIGILTSRPNVSGTTSEAFKAQALPKRSAIAARAEPEKINTSNYQPVWQPDIEQSSDATPANSHAKLKTARDWLFMAASLVWIGTLAANIWAAASAPLNTVHLFIILAAMWASLAMAYVSSERGRAVLTEFAALSGLICFGLAIYVTSLRFGFFFETLTSAALGIFAALAIAIACKSVLALRAGWLLTAVASIIGLQLSSGLEGGTVSLNMQPYLWAMPLIWAAGLYVAHRLEDEFSAILAGVIGFTWAIAAALSAHSLMMITPVMGITAMVTAGLAYSRMGKLFEDTEGFAGSVHTVIGWAVMMGAAMLTQHLWLADPAGLLSLGGFTPSAQPVWAAITAVSLIALLCIELKRSQTRPQSPALALLICVITVGFIWGVLNYETVYSWLTAASLVHVPSAGLALGGALTAIAFGFTLNGSKRRHIPMFLAGLIALCVQTLLVLDTITQSVDSLMIFCVSAFVTALIALTFTRISEQA